jgi:hypothetical protein
MGRPTHRVSITRKDGQDITYTDYRGDQVTRKYCQIGVLFPTRMENGFNLVLERKVTLDPDLFWVNVYPQEDREREPKNGAGARRSAARRAPAAPQPQLELFEGAPGEPNDDGDLPG